jgi:formylglycine-generating enzyme required for sulfatase activity
MEKVKWLVIALATLIIGFLGHRLAGNWIGTAVAAASGGMVVALLLNTLWTKALFMLVVGTYGFFQVASDGSERAARVAKPAITAKANPADASAGLAEPTAKESEAKTAAAAVGGAKQLKDCADCPALVVIPEGQFAMGSIPAEPAQARELPQHRVTVRSFAAARFAVTRGEFAAFVKATHYQTDAERSGGCFAWTQGKWENNAKFNWRQAGFAQTDEHPVVCVSWNDAQAYVQWLGTTSQQNYRLLTEAEREYAARAGTTSRFWWGDTLTPEQANFDTSAGASTPGKKAAWRRATMPVNSFEANRFGMYNVHGNVWEWVQDCQHDNYTGAPTDGSAWISGCSDTRRVLRGGAWVGDPNSLHSASRSWFTPDFRFHAGGFRVARDFSKPK